MINDIKDKYSLDIPYHPMQTILDKCNLSMPKVLKFREDVLKRKGIKLIYRDNINDMNVLKALITIKPKN